MTLERSLRTLLALLAATAMVASITACDDDDDPMTTADMTGADMTANDMTSTAPDTTTTTEPDATTTTDPDIVDPDMDLIDPDVIVGNSIVDVAAADGNFTTLLAAATEAGLADELATGEYTVFAPTDAAFAAFLADAGLTPEELLADPRLATILSYHVVPGTVDSGAVVAAAPKIPSLIDVNLYFDVSAGVSINAGAATVTTPDIAADNGIIHVIDGVLMPPTIPEVAQLEGGFDTLVTAATTATVDANGTTVADVLADDTAEFTVLAPTDQAFADFLTDAGIEAGDLLASPDLTGILTYHAFDSVLDAATVSAADSAATLTGIKVYIDNSGAAPVLNGSVNVIVTDVPAVNGIIHAIDYVLVPPTIDQVAGFEGAFSTLLTAATTAEIDANTTVADALAVPDAEITLLAPTDAAFTQFLADAGITAQDLLESPDLTNILLYHAAAGVADAAAVSSAAKVGSLYDGIAVYIDASSGSVVLNGTVNVTTTDVFAANGVIHVLDYVLTPPNMAEVATFEGLDTLVAALGAANLDTVVAADDADLTVFAPTEQAFADALAALGIDAATLLADPTLGDILTYHVVGGTTLAETVVALDGAWVPSLLLQQPDPLSPANDYYSPLIVDVDGTVVTLNGVNVSEVDIRATNGVIHTIDAVLLPQDAVEVATAAGLSELLAVATALNLGGALTSPEGPYTIFAPSNQAFTDLYTANNGIGVPGDVPLGAVQFHIVPGLYTAADVVGAAGTGLMTAEGTTLDISVDAQGVVTVGGTASAIVETIDVPSTNAIIHVIDSVMLP